MTSACGSLLSYFVAQVRSKKVSYVVGTIIKINLY